ncbi:MAG: HAD-IA family hydrolase [Bryobacteraceae bacterium]
MRSAFLFDLDGVVIHSMPMHTEAWRIYLKRYGLDPGDLEARMHGRRNDQIVAEYFGKKLSPEEAFHHGAAKEALFREMMAPQFEEHLVPGLLPFLECFASIPKAIGTNAEPANVSFVLDRAGIRPRFRVIVDGMQVGKPKPDPEIYLTAAERLGVEPSGCIVFEDSPAGVAAGRAAGMRVVGITTTADHLEGVEIHARDFFDSELASWLRRAIPDR